MTIIEQFNGFHIERHQRGPLTVNAGATISTDIPLDRPGQYMACQVSTGRLTATDRVISRISNGGGAGQINFGDFVSSIRVWSANFDGATNELNYHFEILVFVRDITSR